MEAFSTTRNNEEAIWEKPSIAEPDPLPSADQILAPKSNKSASVRLVGEDQPSRPLLGKWMVVLLCAILSTALVYLLYLRA